MGLIFPSDLEAWQKWQQSQQSIFRRINNLRNSNAPSHVAHVRGLNPEMLIALDSVNPSSIASLLSMASFFPNLAVLSQTALPEAVLGSGWQITEFGQAGKHGALDTFLEIFESVKAVVSSGNYLPVGSFAYCYARQKKIPFVVTQHGLMTPFAPPLPEGAHLLAFSEEDAQFWKSGRTDVSSEVVGAQLVWDAQHKGKRELTTDEPLFLGQLHGAEISRSVSSTTAKKFCRETGAIYRPHPSETDILSRIQHNMWERQGIYIDRSRKPLLEEPRPVVSIFSTGVIEAAAAGIPSWVMCNKPISWVENFWERYSMSKWGSDPTPPPPQLKQEPALAIASSLQRLMGTTK